jgi:hypothetical protein
MPSLGLTDASDAGGELTAVPVVVARDRAIGEQLANQGDRG